jgi:hypothetical protein
MDSISGGRRREEWGIIEEEVWKFVAPAHPAPKNGFSVQVVKMDKVERKEEGEEEEEEVERDGQRLRRGD